MIHHYFLSIILFQLLNDSLSPFILIVFSVINLFWLVFFNSFSQKIPMISLPLRSLALFVHDTVFFTYLNTTFSSDQFGLYPTIKRFLYFDIPTRLEFWIFFIILNTTLNICTKLRSADFILVTR